MSARRRICPKKEPAARAAGSFARREGVCKPGSVVDNDLSGPRVAARLKPPFGTRRAAASSQLALLRIGFTWRRGYPRPGELLPRLSILTACWGRRSISVALSLGSPPAAVSSCHASVKPGLSSGRSSRPAVVCSTRLCIIIPYFCIICNCCFFVL